MKTAGSSTPPYRGTLRGGFIETALPETATAYGPVLCEPDKPMTFEAVEKPSETVGFFTIGVKETSGVNPSDAPYSPVTILEAR